MNEKAKKMMWCIAAALATGGVVDAEAIASTHPDKCPLERLPCERVELPVQFAQGAPLTSQGDLRTASGYTVRIDRVSMNPCHLDVCDPSVSPQKEEPCAVHIEGQEGERVIRLSGVQLEGRVFDAGHDESPRLPGEGIVIEGSLPVDVLLKRARRVSPDKPWKSEDVLTVEYEFPSEVFEEIDWSMLS